MKILFPWNNLGCLGFVIGRWYVDFFRYNDGKIGMFANTGTQTYWIRFGKAKIRRGM